MHILKVFIFLIFCFFTSISAQWVQTSGPEGGTVECLAINKDLTSGLSIYAGTYSGGIFLSTDYGNSWKAINNGLKDSPIVTSTVFKDNYVFISTSNGCYRSSDNGLTWVVKNKGFYTKVVHCLAIKGNRIFAGTSTGIYASTNNGDNWSLLNSEVTGNISSIAMHDSTILAASDSMIIYSRDNGQNWKISKGVTPTYQISSITSHGKYIYCIIQSNGYRSADDGESWVKSDSGIHNPLGGKYFISAVASNGKDLFAGTALGIFKSSDNGAYWTLISQQSIKFITHSISVFDSTIIAGTSRQGIFKSTDYGENWTKSNKGFINSFVDVLASDDSSIFAGVEDYKTYRSTNKGDLWEQMSLGSMAGKASSILVVGREIVKSYYSTTLVYSSDYGNTWGPMPGKEPSNIFVNTLIHDTSGFYAGTNGGGAFYKRNSKDDWIAINNGLSNRLVNKLIKDGENLYAATGGGEGIYRSTNNGLNWTAYNSGLSDKNVSLLCQAGSMMFANTPTGLFIFNGSTWTKSSLNVLNNILYLFSKDKYLFAGMGKGLMMTSDYGATWAEIDSGISFYPIVTMTVQGKYIYAGARGGGIFRRPLSDLINDSQSGVSEGKNNNASFSLEQNYPNPFNPSTLIRYSTSASSNVIMKVFDMLGKEICTLVNEVKPKGDYIVEFNVTNLCSGIYIYKLTVNEKTICKKMVFLK